MRVECRGCGCRIGEAGALSGVGAVRRFACGAGVSYAAAALTRHFAPALRPEWLAWVIVSAGLLGSLYALFWAFCPGFYFWWKYRKTACPGCGQRRWTWGRLEGFGV